MSVVQCNTFIYLKLYIYLCDNIHKLQNWTNENTDTECSSKTHQHFTNTFGVALFEAVKIFVLSNHTDKKHTGGWGGGWCYETKD